MKTSNTGEVVGLRIFGGKIAPVGGHPLKGTCQEKKVVRKQEEAFFLRRRCGCENGPFYSSSEQPHLLDSFAPGPIYSQRFTEVSVFPLLKDHLYRIIHLFPIAVVSLGLSVSVLTAPVTHQDQGLQ
jgi:hypothetical protein